MGSANWLPDSLELTEQGFTVTSLNSMHTLFCTKMSRKSDCLIRPNQMLTMRSYLTHLAWGFFFQISNIIFILSSFHFIFILLFLFLCLFGVDRGDNRPLIRLYPSRIVHFVNIFPYSHFTVSKTYRTKALSYNLL